MSREQFEAWAEKERLSLAYGDCGYVYSSTAMAWGAWQAATASSKPIGEVKIYSSSPSDMSPPVDDKSFCVDFVLASDYAALQAERDQLAAESAALNEKMNTLANWPGIEFYSSAWEFNNSDGNAALEFICDVQTPATDRFIAEQRAEGVEMFADYLLCPDLDEEIRGYAAQLRNEVKV